MSIDLIWLGNSGSAPPRWPGLVVPTPDSVTGVAAGMDRVLAEGDAPLVLFWDESLGAPEPSRLEGVSKRAGDGWHAGPQLGTSGQPALLDHVAPVWMFNRDPEVGTQTTSWRVSLACFLVRRDALEAAASLDESFGSLAGAGIDLGYRMIKSGALLRYAPDIAGSTGSSGQMPPADEFTFVRRHFGGFWATWSLLRSWLGRSARRGALSAYLATRKTVPVRSDPYERPPISAERLDGFRGQVSVLIPTLDRYPFVHNLLGDLETQTIPPREVIVVDQSRPEDRDRTLANEEGEFRIEVVELDTPGQCSSRNEGIRRASGRYILLLDDDIQAPPDLIEQHALLLAELEADVSTGVADEVGAELPSDFTFVRAANVLSTGNMLIERSAFVDGGLFDLAFERGQRADQDLGMRLYLAGKLTVLNPRARIVHFRAPRGGLRRHKARTVTFARSRRTLTVRNIPAPTEIYLWMRHYRPEQVRSALWLRALGTVRAHGSPAFKLLRALVAALLLPNTILRVRAAQREAKKMLERFPEIPELDERPGI